jgi:hypothetical protein
MNDRRGTYGYALAALGSVGLIASLWQPWYSFTIPGATLDQAVQQSQQFGTLGPLISQGAELLRHLGPLHVTAWQVFTATPAALLVIGVIAGGLSMLALAGSATGVSRIVARVGVSGIAIAGYRFVVRPTQSDLLHPAWGLYLALGSAVILVAGGLIAAAEQHRRDPASVTLDRPYSEPVAPSDWVTAGSVPPPA